MTTLLYIVGGIVLTVIVGVILFGIANWVASKFYPNSVSGYDALKGKWANADETTILEVYTSGQAVYKYRSDNSANPGRSYSVSSRILTFDDESFAIGLPLWPKKFDYELVNDTTLKLNDVTLTKQSDNTSTIETSQEPSWSGVKTSRNAPIEQESQTPQEPTEAEVKEIALVTHRYVVQGIADKDFSVLYDEHIYSKWKAETNATDLSTQLLGSSVGNIEVQTVPSITVDDIILTSPPEIKQVTTEITTLTITSVTRQTLIHITSEYAFEDGGWKLLAFNSIYPYDLSVLE